MRDEAETHATRVIREATGVGLRDEEIDTVELPSSFSKRQLYYRYCFHNGYVVKSDAKGNMPSMKNHKVRTTFDIHYPEGSVPKPVCDWKAFRTFWKDNYPKMTIRPPSHDTCAECWKYRNELGVVSRLQNEAARLQIRNNFDCENQLEDEDTNMNDQDDTTNEDHSNDNNNVNSSNTEVENYIAESVEEYCPPFAASVENVVSKFKLHVDQYSNMRNLVKEKVEISREHELVNKEWSKRTIVHIADFAQNLDLPHFGSEQPGDIYYFSPLGIYLFGIVSPSKKKDTLLCQYYTEGEGAKGGNNVASMLWNNLKHSGFVDKSKDEGALGEYVMIMDNCGGQNKNRMVIRFLLMLTEIGIFKKASNVYLVRGHTKNACDRMFMLLKQHFHYKNVYKKNSFVTTLIRMME